MAVLRTSKDTLNVTPATNGLFTSGGNSTTTLPSISTRLKSKTSIFDSLRKIRADPAPTTEPEAEHNHQRQVAVEARPQSALAKFRQKLSKEASTFSRRSKLKRGDPESFGPQTPRSHTLSAFESGIDTFNQHNFPERPSPLATAVSDTDTSTETDSAPYPPPIRFYHSPSSAATQIHHPTTSPLPILVFDQSSLCEEYTRRFEPSQAGYQEVQSEGSDKVTWRTMASEQVPPPVAYERLRQLTTEACDSTLSSIKTYSHANTESWNTAIINTILTALVTECTTSFTEDSPAQPNFKFIVNSTIIQHAPIHAGAGDDAVRSAGRRGMHSASGAFWNNAKDGMWSFKYEAAEAKGLDVVVGIVWVWVG